MKSTLRKLTNALLLVGLGFAVYYAGPVARELFEGDRVVAPLPVAPALADGPRETEGNVYLQQALVAMQRRASITVTGSQTGRIEGRAVTSQVEYLQLGSGRDRRFRLRLQGSVTDDRVSLQQVSDGQWLWTDLAWGETTDVTSRQVWRVDLRRLRKDLGEDGPASLRPGEAAADPFDPGLWAGLGGLPMLLRSLDANFRFERPRQMLLWQSEPVYVLVGFWKNDRLAALMGDPSADARAGDPLPARVPHHVQVALGASDLFPRRIEYRGGDDPLSAAGVPPDNRYLYSSDRPLLQLSFKRPSFDAAIAQMEFEYTPPEGVDWADRTSDRLKMLRSRRDDALAQATGLTSGARSR